MSETENTPDPVTEAFDEYVVAFRAGRGDADGGERVGG